MIAFDKDIAQGMFGYRIKFLKSTTTEEQQIKHQSSYLGVKESQAVNYKYELISNFGTVKRILWTQSESQIVKKSEDSFDEENESTEYEKPQFIKKKVISKFVYHSPSESLSDFFHYGSHVSHL